MKVPPWAMMALFAFVAALSLSIKAVISGVYHSTIIYAGIIFLLTYVVPILIKYFSKLDVVSHVSGLGNSAGLALSIITNGAAFFFVPPFLEYLQTKHHGHRLYVSYGPYLKWPFFLTIFCLTTAGLFLAQISMELARPFFFYILYCLIPFDFVFKLVEKVRGNSIGAFLFFESLLTYMFVGLFVLFSAIAIAFATPIYSLIFAILAAALTVMIFLFSKKA